MRDFSIQMLPFFIGIIFHEYAHGRTALRWGDTTARDEGRLTLNPIPHLDPLGTILFPILNAVTGIPILIGWAKPVPINPNRFKNYRKGLFWVSFAGPLMNVALALISGVAALVVMKYVPMDFTLYDFLVRVLGASIGINYWLAIFNLLPLPPLDGSKMIESFLSYNASRKYEQITPYSFYILMFLLISGSLGVLYFPVRMLTEGTIGLARMIVQI